MKKITLYLSIAIFLFMNAASFAGEEKATKLDYDCISFRLEAINSDIFYALSPAEIDDILSNPGDGGYSTVLSVAQSCESNP